MEINRNNYGAFFLDYWESNLDSRGKEALTMFLEKNPELQDEFLDFSHSYNSKLTDDDDLIFPNKRFLKKIQVNAFGEINQHNWEQYVIGYLEHDLNPSQIKLYEDFISSNPQIAGEVDLFRKTYLKPDHQIVFDQKGTLKRKVIPVWWSSSIVKLGVSAAAIILIALSLFWNTSDRRLKEIETPQLTESQIIPDIISDILPPEEDKNTTEVGFSALEPVEIARLEPPEVIRPAAVSSQKLEESLSVQAGREIRQESTLISLNSLSSLETIPVTYFLSHAIEPRDEFSQVFDFLLIRDGLIYDNDQSRSTIGRLIAAVGNQFSGNRQKPVENLINPVIAAVAQTGKSFLTTTSELLPVYQTLEDTGRKETYFEVGENFNIRRSRNKTTEP